MPAEDQLQAWLQSWTPLQAVGWLLVENALQILICVGVGVALRRALPRRQVSPPPDPLTRAELIVTALTWLGNTAVTWLGWLLWRRGLLSIAATRGWVEAAVDAAGLLLTMDLAMYLTHRLAHWPLIFGWVHGLHHRYQRVRPLTLFVLSPLEVGGFGALWLAVLAVWRPSWAGMLAYLLLNAAWGAMGHSGVEPLPRRLPLLTGGRFHADHHLDPNGNFGFYTDLWDRLAGTRLPVDD